MRKRRPTLFPYTTLFRSKKRIAVIAGDGIGKEVMPEGIRVLEAAATKFGIELQFDHFDFSSWDYFEKHGKIDRKSTRLNSSHVSISYAVFCLKKKISISF